MSSLNFLHYFTPNPVLLSLGPFTIYWYGVFIVIGMMLGIVLTLKLAKLYKIDENKIIDLSFWLIIFSIIGARIYHVLLELPYYLDNPLQIFMLWNGGIAIHGAIFAGLLTIWFYSKKHSLSLLKITSIIVPSLALAQTIGRWGNYFNQELFGRPTNLPWGIPINPFRLPPDYLGVTYFHPTFLYESIGNLLIFLILIYLNYLILKFKKIKLEVLTFVYLLLYSLLRFTTEFIRIDKTPEMFGLRLPQIVSILIVIISLYFLYKFRQKNTLEKN
ncbi:MAG: prolipoprotein diacylglyceryl transferase [Patescibacteria group bacterium]|jgi:phosphatidylglycerol:prolipoprotein diacylglycerol transferase|nr:prolipoprotein diacylglyceryl transferase [Patescibacteria group bacterium]